MESSHPHGGTILSLEEDENSAVNRGDLRTWSYVEIRCQWQSDKCCVIPFMRSPWSYHIHRDRKWNDGASATDPHPPASSTSRNKWAVSAWVGSGARGDTGAVAAAKACRALCIFIKRRLFLDTGKCIQSSRTTTKKTFTFEECLSIVEMACGAGWPL